MVKDIVQDKTASIWPDNKGLRVLGCGFPFPYWDDAQKTERIISAIPKSLETCPEQNKYCTFEHGRLPFETNSMDRVWLMHDLEFAHDPNAHMSEIYRVLKSSGRFIMIVPNRGGAWTHADWSPFGQGRPYNLRQLQKLLADNRFTIETSRETLFTPPIRHKAILKTAKIFEKAGSFLPLPAGLNIIESSKQIYARADNGTKAPAFAKRFVPKTATSLSSQADHQD